MPQNILVVNAEGPPERMCGLCAQKLARLQPREQPCKVHGCTRTWTWDRASQMRAWVASGSDDLDFEPAAPRRMCEVCREFCRTHSDREVGCGRPECNNTWTFKTGAQRRVGGRRGNLQTFDHGSDIESRAPHEQRQTMATMNGSDGGEGQLLKLG